MSSLGMRSSVAGASGGKWLGLMAPTMSSLAKVPEGPRRKGVKSGTRQSTALASGVQGNGGESNKSVVALESIMNLNLASPAGKIFSQPLGLDVSTAPKATLEGAGRTTSQVKPHVPSSHIQNIQSIQIV
jgi:hypothetical protein